MEVLVLGSCCGHGETLRQMVLKILAEHGLQGKVTVRVTEDTIEIMSYGILATPGLVVNSKLKLNGRLPKEWEVKSFLFEEITDF